MMTGEQSAKAHVPQSSVSSEGVCLKLLVMATVLAVGLCPVATLAQEDAAAAKAHYTAGLQHFNLSEYEQALTEFKDAYRSKPDPVFLYNIGQCHRKLGHADEAATFYRRYLREAPDAKNRNEVERRIAEVGSQPNAQRPPSAGETPGPSPTSYTALAHAASETATTTPSVDIDLPFGEGTRRGSARPIYKRWWFWAATGAVTVGAAALAIVMANHDPTWVPPSTLGAQRAMP
jgi:tetratricopeptide (TPR) repeat protein